MVAVFTHWIWIYTAKCETDDVYVQRAGTGKMNCRNKLSTNLIQSSYVTSPNF